MVTEAHGPPPPVPLWYGVLAFVGAIIMMTIYGMPLENGNFWPEGPLLAYIVVTATIGALLAFYRKTQGGRAG